MSPHSLAQRVVISWLTWLSLTSEAPEDNLVPGGLTPVWLSAGDLILDISC